MFARSSITLLRPTGVLPSAMRIYWLLLLDNCQKKIKARISKVLRRVREFPTDRGIHSEDRLPLELVEKFKANLRIDPEQSLRNRLISWLDNLSPAPGLKDPKFLRNAIINGYSIGIDSDINLLIDQKLLRRIRKLGDYLGVVIQLVAEVNLLSSQVLQTLVIQEVRTEITGFCTV